MAAGLTVALRLDLRRGARHAGAALRPLAEVLSARWSFSPTSSSASSRRSRPSNLLWCFVGVLLGTMVGVLPGIGPTATIAMLLPITFKFEPVDLADHARRHLLRRAVRRLHDRDPDQPAGRILLRRHRHRRLSDGAARGGPARRSPPPRSARSSPARWRRFVLVLFAPPLARAALKFGPPEYFSLIVLGLVASIALAHGSILKALAMIVLGLLFGMVGQDIYTGTPRFTFGIRELYSGINFVSVAVGIFGVAEILRNLENEKTRTVLSTRDRQALALARGFPPHRRAGAARHGARLDPRHPARRRARACVLRRLFDREAHLAPPAGIRPRRDRGRGRRRNRPTTPPRRRPSSRS